MATTQLDGKQILETVSTSGHKVKIAIADMDGILRGKYLHMNKFLSAAAKGLGFCNVVLGWDCGDIVYDNSRYTGWHTGYPDADVHLDLSTYRRVPWDGDVPFFLGEFVDRDHKPLPICPRQLLKRVLARAQKAGFDAFCGVEYEWFNFRETPHTLDAKNYTNPSPLTPGMFGYSIIRASQDQPFFNAIMDELRKFDIPIEGLHTETGPGVFEAAIVASDALEAADRAVLFKTSVKELAHPHGIMPSFMAKWNPKLPGCSGHVHQSLRKKGTEENVFFDDADSFRMSDTFKHYLAGQMQLFPEILPMVAPTINSYKRLVEGHWAPTRTTWGIDNRTAAFRVISGSQSSTRLETRVCGSDINPYLALAACIGAGVYGIENRLQLKTPPVEGNAYKVINAPKFPANLHEAATRMAESSIAKDIFGPEFVEHFTQSRIWEWRQFQEAVTDWETRRYFEII